MRIIVLETGCLPADENSVYAQGITLAVNGASTITCSIGIGTSITQNTTGTVTYKHPTRQNCVLYLPTYKLSPEEDARYISSNESQTVLYRDYQVISNNAQLTNLAGEIRIV